MNVLTVSEFFVFIIIIIIIFLVLICWKIYLFEKKRPNPPPVDIRPILANTENLSKQMGDCISRLEAVPGLSAKLDPIAAIQKSVGELSDKIITLSDQAGKAEEAAYRDQMDRNMQTVQATLEALSSAVETLSAKSEEENRKNHQKQLSDISLMLEKIMQQIPVIPKTPTEKPAPPKPSLSPAESPPEKAEPLPENKAEATVLQNPETSPPAEKQTVPLAGNGMKKAEPGKDMRTDDGKETAETMSPTPSPEKKKKTQPGQETVPPPPNQADTPADIPKEEKKAEDDVEKKTKELLARI